MKFKTLLISAFAITAGLQYASAQTDPVVEKIIETGQNDNRTMEYLDILSNRIGGRLIGSYAYDNAVDWCVSMFDQWGLEVWKQEAAEIEEHYKKFGDKLPAELRNQLEALKTNLDA